MFSRYFIDRPIGASMLSLAIIILGGFLLLKLPVAQYPEVAPPTIQVSAALPGGSPETMAASVATPLERQFSTIAGLDNMTSTSSMGFSSITLQFSLDRNLDAAAQDVQAAITAAARQLPPNMPAPPSFQRLQAHPSPSPAAGRPWRFSASGRRARRRW